MQSIPLCSAVMRVFGAVDVEVDEQGLRVYRLLRKYLPLAPEFMLDGVHMPSGVRLSFCTDSPSLELELDVPPCGLSDIKVAKIDVLADGNPAQQWTLKPRSTQCLHTDALGDHTKLIDIYLPQVAPVLVKAVRVAESAVLTPNTQRLPRWITYGSSITHCGESDGPATTWAALVARQRGLELFNMGFGSNGVMDACAARSLAETPADRISLKLAVNALGSYYNERTFVSAALNMILTIRDKQPETPILLITPIYNSGEETPGTQGLDLLQMRRLDQEIFERMQRYGDTRIAFLDGRRLFGPEDIHLFDESGVHPNAEAQFLIANRFSELAFGPTGFLRLAE